MSRQAGVSPDPLEVTAGSNRRAENLVLALLLGTMVGAVAFIVIYIIYPSTQLLGLSLGLALVMMGIAFAVTGKLIVPQEKATEEYHDYGDAEVQEEVVELVDGGGRGVSRRRLLIGTAGAAGATVGGAALLPLASMGPSVGAYLSVTPWQRGRRLVDSEGVPLKPEEIEVGTFRLAFPEGASQDEIGSSVNVLKEPAENMQVAEELLELMPEGVIAFSRICPHAGCAVATYRYPLYEPTFGGPPALVCPCHYSTFDVRQGGKLTFGPAGRDLPILPLGLNAERELIALGDFLDRVGPSWGGVRQDPDTPLEPAGGEG
ncbi:MAG TPA: Rieske 2Fe-2S domain-containing protein [Solirubrobacteraceae bacterium]|nr:Rieske 2Fe-2S domain-containing protein [Solirubrobacteraceae bacterium]